MRLGITFAVFGWLVLTACSATEISKTNWSASPNGEWQTRIVKTDTSGPGNSSLSETVQLRRPGSDEPVDVLTLNEDFGPAEIRMNWRDPNHLIVNHTGGAVVFQVVRVAELSIETRG